MAKPVGSAGLASTSEYVAKRSRTALAPYWRKSIRWGVVLIGLGLFVCLEMVLAKLIDGESWYLIVAAIVFVISVMVVILRPTAAYLGWLFLSPWVSLFLAAWISGFPVDFDRVILLLIVIVLAFRCMAYKLPLKKLLLPECLLIATLLYSQLPGIITVSDRVLTLGRFRDLWGMLLTPTVVYFVAKGCITEKKHVRWALGVFLAIGLTWAMSGIYEQAAGKAWFSPFIGMDIAIQGEHDIGRGRSTGPGMHYYIYGMVLVLGAYTAMHLAGYTDKVYQKCLYYIAFIVSAVALYYGYSRAPYIAFGVCAVLLTLLTTRSRRRYAVLTLMMGLAILYVAPKLLQDANFEQRMTADTATARLAISATSVNIIRDHLLFGIGYGNYQSVAPLYVSSKDHPRIQGRYDPTPILSRPHNEYLMVLAEQGVVGGVLYIGMYIAFLIHMFRMRARLQSDGMLGKDLMSFFITFSIAVLVVMMSDEFQLHLYMYYALFTVFALATRLGELGALQQASVDDSHQTPGDDSYEALLAVSGSKGR